MEGFGFENQFSQLVGDAVGEVQAHAFGGGGPDFDGQHVVVAGGGFVAQMAFEHGEDGVAFLPLEERGAEVAEEFAARDFEQVQVAPVVNVVADGAIGVGDAVRVVEAGHAGSLCGRSAGSCVCVKDWGQNLTFSCHTSEPTLPVFHPNPRLSSLANVG